MPKQKQQEKHAVRSLFLLLALPYLPTLITYLSTCPSPASATPVKEAIFCVLQVGLHHPSIKLMIHHHRNHQSQNHQKDQMQGGIGSNLKVGSHLGRTAWATLRWEICSTHSSPFQLGGHCAY